MKKIFVKNITNYERFRTGISAVETRGATEASLMLVTAPAGYGKSQTVDQWAVANGAAYLRAKVEWTPRYFMTELAETLKLDSRGRAKDIFGRIAGVLGGQQIPLVIDEVEHCLRDSAQVLEAIRDLSDLTEVIVILVGMDQVQAKIARHAQISSRIAKVVEFHPATLEDVAEFCKQLSEVEIGSDLVAEILRQSAGRVREIMNAIATVEQTARRNGKASASLQDMAGQVLTHDWQARRPRVVATSKGR
ncbi:MAG: chromosome partitioning protein ParA [Gallionellales bacterium GWA2_60_18]|nr:MAG: chromosome partitioning protein ParA [Gallionellales bacterium GWA2_60_18]